MKPPVVVYGASWCADCKAVKQFLDEHNVTYEYLDVDEDQTAKQKMLSLNGGVDRIPTVAIGDDVLVEPLPHTLGEKLGITPSTSTTQHEVVMIGAGPSALAAAVYTTREDVETLLMEKSVIGGLAAITDWVDNYPGFPQGVAGLELAEQLQKQAERFGARIQFGEVFSIHGEKDGVRLTTSEGDMKARAVLIATGSDYRKIGVPGEQEYYGRGVHYCATCDGAFYRDKRLAVVGGGNSAVQEAIFLTRFAAHIDLLVRSEIRASEILQHELQKFVDDGKIAIHLDTATDEIVAADGKAVSAVKITTDGQQKELSVDGVFVFVGLLPNTGFLKDSGVVLDERGLIQTDDNLMTAIPGVFASGDVRSGATMQIASAVGEGATAALKIREYLEGRLV